MSLKNATKLENGRVELEIEVDEATFAAAVNAASLNLRSTALQDGTLLTFTILHQNHIYVKLIFCDLTV